MTAQLLWRGSNLAASCYTLPVVNSGCRLVAERTSFHRRSQMKGNEKLIAELNHRLSFSFLIAAGRS